MIVCAAVKIHFKKTDEDFVFSGLRHGDIRANLRKTMEVGKDFYFVEEGFIDNNGNFWSRRSAFNRAIECGQLSTSTRWYKEDHGDEELYSEDLLQR